ncbi:MAG: hypothetical protein NC429_16980, partial [Lachnospiraceae bacterium]|nr:hypothetical protein [Lachnospiraceae bacterium]
KQGAHSKAQFIVNAVLHYVNCPETPDISLPQAADRASIEKIVMDILHGRDSGQQDNMTVTDSGKAIREEQIFTDLSEQRYNAESEQKETGGNTWAMIADTMSAFRNS